MPDIWIECAVALTFESGTLIFSQPSPPNDALPSPTKPQLRPERQLVHHPRAAMPHTVPRFDAFGQESRVVGHS